MLEQILAQHLAGRGLWIGLHPDDAFTTVVYQTLRTTDLHATLVHLGKGHPGPTVALFHKVAQDVAGRFSRLGARVGGVARFRGNEKEGDPIVLLLQNRRIRRVRESLIATLEAQGYQHDDYFDYTPHATVGRLPQGVELSMPLPTMPTELVLTRLGITCGDAREYFPLNG